MNALVMPALGLANRSAQALPGLFADLAHRSPAVDITRIESAGHHASGAGAGTYIADALADDALASAHPRFVVRTANGRLFRLLPEAGSVAVEQGGALGDGTADDQPAIQATIAYAEAVGAGEVRFESEIYRLHCPQRFSPAEQTRALDGHPLVVRGSLALRGVAPGRTVLDFRGLDGSDPDPAPRAIARLELDRLVFQGNRSRTGQSSYPADVTTGDGWDITDRGFWLQDVFVGDVICRDTDFIGWRGELFYAVGADDAIERITMARCRLLTGNGNGFNLGCDPMVAAEDCEFGDCTLAQEDTGKTHGHFRNCLWRDCEYVWMGGGSVNGRLYTYKYPTRDDTAPVPATVLDNCRFEDCGIVWVNSWVSGRIRTVDTMVGINSVHGFALRDIDLEIDAWLDRRDNYFAVALRGPPTLTEPVEGAPAGVYQQPPKQIRLKVRHFRSALAQDQGREWIGVTWSGYLDRSCRIVAEGEFANARSPNGGDNPVSFPYVRFDGGNASTAYTAQGLYRPANLTASGSFAPAGPAIALGVASAIAVGVTLRASPAGGAAYGYADGQPLRIVKNTATGSIAFTKGAAASMAMTATRTLAAAHDWIEFRYNRALSRWEESGFGGYS